MWKTRSKLRPPSPTETERLLSVSPEFYHGCDEMLQVLNAYQTVGSHLGGNTSRLKVPGLGRFFTRFRSGSMDSDKAALSSLDDDSNRSKPYTSNDTVSKKDYPAASPRQYPSDAVWVTSASHPSPFSSFPTDAQGQPLTGSRTQGYATGFLSDLALQNTPLTSATSPSPAATSDSGTGKMTLPGTALTAQELHNSVLSALGKTQTSPVQSPGEKKPSKKQPSGTFEYVVQEGDTLVKVAAHFDVTPSELMKINRLVSRTVFVGQTLYIPDPNYVAAADPPTPRSASPVTDSRPKMDIPLASLPTVPGHAVPVTSPTSPKKTSTQQLASSRQRWWSQSQKSQEEEEEEETDKECLQKFLKMPVRRVMEEGEGDNTAGSEGFTVKGTLLVTPNAMMFDPSVNDPIVIDKDDQLKFSVVVYMEEIKSVALFHDISPRMFWKQPKELRSDSPKPETYRSGQGKRLKADGHDDTADVVEAVAPGARLTPDGISVGGDSGQRRASPDGRDAASESKGDTLTGRMSAELEQMAEISVPVADLIIHPGRASQEVEHAMTSLGYTPASPVIKQMSHSSELEVCEISQFQDATDVFGETRDFGGHMGRSSSEVHRQSSSALGRVSDASPGDMSGHWFYQERSDSTGDNLNTPTQGFAPVHFTDRSPMTVTTHPKPVPGQRLMLLSQSPVTHTDLKSQENRIAEDMEVGATDSGGQSDISMVTGDQHPCHEHDSLSHFSSVKNHLEKDSKSATVTVPDSQSGDHALVFSLAAVHGDSQTVAKKTADAVADKLVQQVADFNLGAAGDKGNESDDDSSKPAENSPRLPFSPLRTPAQHISSFFNYTSSFFRNSTAAAASEKDDCSTDGKGRYASVATSVPYRIQLKSEFTKADITRALGPDPKEFLLRSDSHHFEETPLYLQIRRGFQKDKEILQPRAFDHRNVSPLLDEYWFVVPRDMGDKLYSFLMEWQPDAYGDEEETQPRERFFYDVGNMEDRTHLVSSNHSDPTIKAASDGPQSVFLSSDDHLNETEKTWEILSKEEVYRAEKEQAVHREDVVDESSFPELIGQTVIIKEEHIRALMRSLPRNMSVGYNWELVYATHKHGYSLHNLYMRTEDVDNDAPVLLFITDTFGSVFGAYLSNTIRPNDTFYGSGATFLFTFYPTFKKFPWQGCNQFFMHGTKEFFTVGSGEGLFGLWLDGDLNKGRSQSCATFNNDVLAKEEDFSILQLEVWRFVDSSLL